MAARTSRPSVCADAGAGRDWAATTAANSRARTNIGRMGTSVATQAHHISRSRRPPMVLPAQDAPALTPRQPGRYSGFGMSLNVLRKQVLSRALAALLALI